MRTCSGGDPRVVELVRICADLADDVGMAFGEADAVAAVRRDDYALAAGPDHAGTAPSAIATGNDSVNWAAVPPGVFDAAENTVEWRVEAADGVAKAVVRVELSGSGLAGGDPRAAAVRRPRRCRRARRRRRSERSQSWTRPAAARHGIGCVGS